MTARYSPTYYLLNKRGSVLFGEQVVREKKIMNRNPLKTKRDEAKGVNIKKKIQNKTTQKKTNKQNPCFQLYLSR